MRFNVLITSNAFSNFEYCIAYSQFSAKSEQRYEGSRLIKFSVFHVINKTNLCIGLAPVEQDLNCFPPFMQLLYTIFLYLSSMLTGVKKIGVRTYDITLHEISVR